MDSAHAVARHQTMLASILGIAMPDTLAWLRPRGADVWRDKAALLMVELRQRPDTILAPFMLDSWSDADGGLLGRSASARGHFMMLAEGIASVMLMTKQPFSLLGVTFQDACGEAYRGEAPVKTQVPAPC